jgi:hydrogenase maturation protease
MSAHPEERPGAGWDALAGRAPRTVEVDGVHVGRGSLVRLRPRAGGDGGRADVFDAALAGRVAVVESLMQSIEGDVQLAVVLEDDPGRDLGVANPMGGPRSPATWPVPAPLGHRFFFSVAEVEPLPGSPAMRPDAPSVLVAGIGNVLLADDGFGVEAARLLAQRELPAGVKVADFGIRGMDLAYELQEDWDVVVLLDAVPRGQAPGTLFVIEHDPGDEADGCAALDPHGMDPLRVLALARVLGAVPPRVLVVGCEPAVVVPPDDERLVMELSPLVRTAARRAVELVETLIDDLMTSEKEAGP